jgi:cytochrome c oxidase subunit 2
MKTTLKLILAAAAFALAPAAALSQGAPAPAATQPAAQAPAAAPPEVSNQAEPSNAQVLSGSPAVTAPDATVGQPTGAVGFQPQVTPIGREALWFHNVLLMPIITVISIFVLGLLLFVVVRFRRGAHPVPSRTTHNTLLEVVWTLVPVLILVAIAVPSIRLLAHQYSPPKADLTIKAIGNQWNWSYEYPDHGISFDSYMLKEKGHTEANERARTAADGPRLLAADERVVVPRGAVVKMIVTASDVIHSWGVPAVPGRLNETWFRADRAGVYYGQCFELCGARHAFMPITVEVVEPAQFAAWVASKGGKMPGANPPRGPDSTAASPVTNPAPAPASGGSEATPEPTLTPGTATAPVTNQAAETTRGN